MDKIDPGFDYPPDPKIESLSTTNARRGPTVTSPEQMGRMRFRSRGFRSLRAANQGNSRTHSENMKDLGRRTEVHLSRSLDHYCHQRVSRKELEKRVQDQVLTRFMKRQLPGRETSLKHQESGCLKSFLSLCSNLVNKLRPSNSTARDSLPPVLEAGSVGGEGTTEASGNTTAPQNAAKFTHGTQSPLQILVAPQLWLWKFDSECKFPRRKPYAGAYSF